MSLLAGTCGVMVLLLAFAIAGRDPAEGWNPVLLALAVGTVVITVITLHRYRHLDDLVRIDADGIRVVELPPRQVSWHKVESIEIRPASPGGHPVIWVTHRQWRFRAALVLDQRQYDFRPHELLYEMTLLWSAVKTQDRGPAA